MSALPGCAFMAALFAANMCCAQQLPCQPNLIGEDMCVRANEIERELGKLLPLKTGDGTTLIEVSAEQSVVIVVGVWALSGAELSESLRRSGLSVSEFREKGVESTRKMACGADVLASFVRLGGELKYKYVTSDGARIFEAQVVNCR